MGADSAPILGLNQGATYLKKYVFFREVQKTH